MDTKPSVVELWSVTGRAMVISGDKSQIGEIVEQLSLPSDSAVSMARNSYVIGLWGQHLDSYLQRFHQDDVLVNIDRVEQNVL